MLHWRFGVLCVDLWLGRINATRVSKNCRLLFFFLSHSCSCLSPSSICFLLNCFVLFCAISYDFSSTLMACLPCSFSSNNSIDFWWLSTFWRWGDEIFIAFLPFSLANHSLLPLCFFYSYSYFFFAIYLVLVFFRLPVNTQRTNNNSGKRPGCVSCVWLCRRGREDGRLNALRHLSRWWGKEKKTSSTG